MTRASLLFLLAAISAMTGCGAHPVVGKWEGGPGNACTFDFRATGTLYTHEVENPPTTHTWTLIDEDEESATLQLRSGRASQRVTVAFTSNGACEFRFDDGPTYVMTRAYSTGKRYWIQFLFVLLPVGLALAILFVSSRRLDEPEDMTKARRQKRPDFLQR